MKDPTWWVGAANWPRMAEAFDSDPLKAGMLKSYRQTYNPLGKSYFEAAPHVSTAANYLRYLLSA